MWGGGGGGSPAREVESEGVGAPLRRRPGKIGVVPPIPPCNLGRQDASQTVRDGDAVGGATQGETSSLVDVSSPSWASHVEGADGRRALGVGRGDGKLRTGRKRLVRLLP